MFVHVSLAHSLQLEMIVHVSLVYSLQLEMFVHVSLVYSLQLKIRSTEVHTHTRVHLCGQPAIGGERLGDSVE